MANITVYGADWCGMTTTTRAHLDKLGVAYRYVNIDNDRAAAAWVASHNKGKEKKPTLDVDGEVLSTPSNRQLDKVLAEKGIIA
jgi:glutaredoxin